jgi:flagellar basal-body rod protein FlgF
MSTAGAKAQSQRQDVIANNVANADTTAFKRQFAIIQARKDHLSEFGFPPPRIPSDPRRMQGGVHMLYTAADQQEQGVAKVTGRQLDLMIDGEGYFQISRDNQTFLTRSGAFTVNEIGQLARADGSGLVLGTGGPIRLDPNLPVAVNADGTIFQNGAEIGRVSIVTPQNEESMRREGDGVYSNFGTVQAATGKVRQNMLEGSNVNPINEMTELIESARAFDVNIQMVQLQSDGLANLLQTVPRLQ